MFAQFRTLYPTGQLISELLTVHHGKFVVRSLVQVDGKTLATGMSAAESIEEAEDRARWRSLAVLGFDGATPATIANVSPSPVAVVPAPAPAPVAPPAPVAVPAPVAPPAPVAAPVLEKPLTTDNFAISHQSSFVNSQSQLIEEAIAPVPTPTHSSGLRPMVDRSVAESREEFDSSDAWLSSSYGEPRSEPSMSTASQTELLQGAAELRELEPMSVGIPSDSIEDVSETIAQIDATLKFLKWTKKQETDCLQHNYGKPSQGLLSAADLIDYLEYLEIYSRTTEEIKRLGWSSSQGKDYLKQAYEKEARHFLNREELFDFLQYLESLP